ncbi:hypothetical protein V2J09_011200 [Rumex salicifolius]
MFMDPTFVVEGREEANIQENRASKPTTDCAAPKQATDPVVYKLVRVDFDGRLVPATDNELMEVDEYFNYDNGEMFSVADVIQTAGFGFSDDELPDKHLPGGDKDFSQYEYSKGGEEQLNVDVERVAEEERHQSATSSPVHPSGNVNIGKSGFDQQHIMDNKDSTEIAAEQILSTSGSTLHDIGTNQSGKPEDCSNMEDGLVETEATAYTTSSSIKPDFSLLSGEINLDKLTIRELQETFRATFGRGTSVKDKQWLKRRISMGLVNSCDIPMTSFIIKDNKIVEKLDNANCEKVDDALVGEVGTVKDAQVDSDSNTEDANSARSNNLLVESVYDDDSHVDQRAAKRVRKPTKRYIEESSGLENQETVGRLIPLGKQLEVTKDLPKPTDRPAWECRSSAIVMRPDSLGGSGFQVPRVCRIRRCRPRKGIITLTPSILGAGLVGDAARVDGTQLTNIGVQKPSEARTVPFQELPSEENSNKLCSETKIAKVEEEQEAKSADSSGNNSNSNFTAKGGMRRKHHRAWSLSEVVKLVDGVSRYGAGRWSEIKRISFASYSYRTSVDLKDKWRNLLKASFAAMSSDKGISQQQQQQRKPTSMPLPTPILLKVRELAELNGQAPRNFKGSGE